MPILKQYGYLKNEGYRDSYLLPIVLLIVGAMIGGVMMYAIDIEAFKSEFNQEKFYWD